MDSLITEHCGIQKLQNWHGKFIMQNSKNKTFNNKGKPNYKKTNSEGGSDTRLAIVHYIITLIFERHQTNKHENKAWAHEN